MHNKRNNKESKTYVQGLRVFGNTLPRGLKGVLKKNGFNYSEIIGKWNTLVGKEIGNYCYPKSIKMKKGSTNGILILSVKRGNEIVIEYSKKEIINKEVVKSGMIHHTTSDLGEYYLLVTDGNINNSPYEVIVDIV